MVDTYDYVSLVCRGGFPVLAERQAIVPLVPSSFRLTPGRLYS